jgi:hypothetical protein
MTTRHPLPIGIVDGLREIPAGPTDAVLQAAAVRSRISAGIPDTDKVSFLPRLSSRRVEATAVGSGGSNDRDNVMEQGLRKERAISRRRMNGPGKNLLPGKMALAAQSRDWTANASATKM